MGVEIEILRSGGFSFLFLDTAQKRHKRDTKSIGDRSEVRVLAALVEAGYCVSIPFGENQRYDLIAEDQEGRLLKIQVKTGRLRNGAVAFCAYSTHAHRGRAGARRYHGEVDLFAVYCPDTEEIYIIPEAEARVRPLLRIDPPKNNVKKTIRWASDYLFGGGSNEKPPPLPIS